MRRQRNTRVRGIFRKKEGEDGPKTPSAVKKDTVQSPSSPFSPGDSPGGDGHHQHDDERSVTPSVAPSVAQSTAPSVALSEGEESSRRPGTSSSLSREAANSAASAAGSAQMSRPSYRISTYKTIEEDISEGEEEDEDITNSAAKAKHIEASAGTHRLQRILARAPKTNEDYEEEEDLLEYTPRAQKTQIQRVDPHDIGLVADFVSSVVLPPLRVEATSIGGKKVQAGAYPEMQQETLVAVQCQSFESTGTETVLLSALQYPADYTKHKRSLGLFSSKAKGKFRYVLICRSTNRPLVAPRIVTKTVKQRTVREESERGDYDTMFGPDTESVEGEAAASPVVMTSTSVDLDEVDEMEDSSEEEDKPEDEQKMMEEEEISSFPVLVCMTLNSDGTGPDVRKLLPLHHLTTIQDLHATVVQLAFANGETVRLDFGESTTLRKERFIWSLIQVHSMLCLSVMERNALTGNREKHVVPQLNIRNLDRAELQYVATVNGFLKTSRHLCALLDRQRAYLDEDDTKNETIEMEERDAMAYDLMMGNINMRLSLFHSEEERKDSEEILNSFEWTSSLNNEENAAVSVAERLGFMLQMRMRDLEAETCRRLIAWEDEKHYSVTGEAKLFTATDERDTVDQLALASLFKMLEALDTELQSMEDWLQERAAAIKPLTDDCADIEEENRQLEQQWKSYDMLGAEMRRLLQGMDIEESVEKILRNPASVLVYDEDGRVDVEESEAGVEEIYRAGKALQEAMEFPKKSGGLHLDAVSERADGLDSIANQFCTALAHIIVTIMEQFNEEVLAGSDYGKVSKHDTHAMIAKKVRDTQRKFQSALLGYIKLIEILAVLNQDMLPALRDAYSEMVAESILMKKRMKGYFQALPGKNAAYMNKAGKDIKDYAAFSSDEVLELVNAPDIRAALSELLPVIAREAYFTSALFGAASKDRDGREKKRHFEYTRKSVDNASQHFRYYIERTCGILPDQIGGKSTIEMGVKGDPLLCLVGSIYLNEAMDNYIDREKKGGDHSLSLAYVRATILDLRKKADKQWVGWVDKQIEWIRSHDGVPLTGKRAGIFPSFARFPCYLDHLVMACSEGRDDGYLPDILNIKVVSYYLQKLAATLLESLKECVARETTDQQYAANVMQMENTYFFTQAIKRRGDIFVELFAKQVTKANAICKDSTDAYLGWMIKREFATLHELFSKVSKLRKEVGDKNVPNQVPKNVFVRTLNKEANKDIMKEKIGHLFARMEKHLSEEGNLLPVAWKALVKVLYEWFGRWEKMSSQLYGHKLDPSAVDIVKIAKAAGGGAKSRQGSVSDFGFKSILALSNKGGA